MYLDTGTMIGIMIALIASILTIGYSIYIIKTQNQIIQRMSDTTATRRKMQRQITMRSREELLKIKEAFAFAMLDLLDVYDELLATGRVWVADEMYDNIISKTVESSRPTVNDMAKNQEESNA